MAEQPPSNRKRVNIADLKHLPGARDIDADTVDEYAADMLVKAPFPIADVAVLPDGTKYILDGQHRAQGAEKAGRTQVGANIIPVASIEEALWLSSAANTKHGLRRTNKAKRQAVRQALKAKPNEADTVISDHCCVNRAVVAEVRAEIKEEDAKKAAKKAGATCAKKQVEVGETPEQPANSRRSEEPTETAQVEPEKRRGRDGVDRTVPTVEKKPVLDHFNEPVPEKLEAIFGRVKDVEAIMREVSDLKSRILALVKNEADPIWSKMDAGAVEADLDHVRNGMKAVKPYALCPVCKGGERGSGAHCKACDGRGWVSEYGYRQMPKEVLR